MRFGLFRLVLQDDVGDDSPPTELKDDERRQVFHLREQLGMCGVVITRVMHAVKWQFLPSPPSPHTSKTDQPQAV